MGYPQGDAAVTGIEGVLRERAAAIEAMGMPSSWEAIVLEHGRRFVPAPLPGGVVRGEPKNCFSNALAVVLGAPGDPECRYVEGFTWHPNLRGLLIHHGWVTVEGTDVAIDPTLPDPETHEYWGIDFQTEYAVEVMERRGSTGMTLQAFTHDLLKDNQL